MATRPPAHKGRGRERLALVRGGGVGEGKPLRTTPPPHQSQDRPRPAHPAGIKSPSNLFYLASKGGEGRGDCPLAL